MWKTLQMHADWVNCKITESACDVERLVHFRESNVRGDKLDMQEVIFAVTHYQPSQTSFPWTLVYEWMVFLHWTPVT